MNRYAAKVSRQNGGVESSPFGSLPSPLPSSLRWAKPSAALSRRLGCVGDELVVDTLDDHAARHRLSVGQLVDGFDHSHRLLELSAGPDVNRLASLLTRSEDRVRRSDARKDAAPEDLVHRS